MSNEELAREIVAHLGGEPSDVSAVEDWLLDGGDDGSSIPDLADRFDMIVGLPSQSPEEE